MRKSLRKSTVPYGDCAGARTGALAHRGTGVHVRTCARTRGQVVDMSKKRNQPEAALQRALCDLLEAVAAPGVVWFAVPNGGSRSGKEGALMSRQGVKPGVLDLAFILPPSGRAAFLELKANKRKIIKGSDQDLMRAAILAAGGLAEEANTLEAAVAVLRSWGVITVRIMGIAA